MKPQLSVIGREYAYEIDKGIPIPPPASRRRCKYPFAVMKVGDSFFVPGGKRSTIRSAVHTRRKAHPNERWVVRTKDNGVRVWRAA